MNRNHLKSAVATALSQATAFVEVFESLPRRHRIRDRSVVIEAPPDLADSPPDQREEPHVGGFVATVSEPDMETFQVVIEDLRLAGCPTAAFARVVAVLTVIKEFQDRYVARELAAMYFMEFAKAVEVYGENAREALDDADARLKAWLTSLPLEVKQIGVKIGDTWYLTTAHVAELTHTTQDAARKLIREKALPVHRIGRKNYVRLDDFLAATRDSPSDEAG